MNMYEVKKLSIFLFFFMLLILTGCGKLIFKPDKLTLEKEDYFGSELKISGYYYHTFSENDVTRVVVYFFFNNGVILHAGAISEVSLSQTEEEFQNGAFYDNVKNRRSFWGVFNIVQGGGIKFERWYPGEAQKAYVREGTILNDSTFHITESYRNRKGKKTEVQTLDEVYHFKQFSPKPDSTNRYTD